jgi:hypothetical protein
MMKQKKQVYVIIRVDDFHDPSQAVEDRISVQEIVSSLEVVESKVARLNELNNPKGARYFWQATRLAIDEGAI